MKTILIAVQTVNGVFSINRNSLTDWSSKEDKEYYKQITKKSGAVIMGRRTYDTLKKPLKDRFNVVMTKYPEKYNSKDNIFFTDMKAEELLKHLVSKGYEEVVISGGQTINTLFLNANLIDEIHISIEPKIFHGELGMFSENIQKQNLFLFKYEKRGNNIFLIYKLEK